MKQQRQGPFFRRNLNHSDFNHVANLSSKLILKELGLTFLRKNGHPLLM